MLFAGNLTRQPCFDEMREENTGYRQVGSLENTDNLMNHAFWFGVYPGMTQAHLDHIIQVIGTHVSSAGIV
jgi:CDP-6-deoxy-D-xylo-4-hexulose-3-dehydrase